MWIEQRSVQEVHFYYKSHQLGWLAGDWKAHLHDWQVEVGCWLGIQPYLWAGDFSSSWGRPLHSVLGLPHIMVAGFQEKLCWWNKIEMHAFLRASLSKHIASLLLFFFIAQGTHKGLGFKVEGIDFTTQWGGVSKSFLKKSMLSKGCCYSYLGKHGWLHSSRNLCTYNTASFLGAWPICTIYKMVPSSPAFFLGSSQQEIWGRENSEFGVFIHQNLSLQGCFEWLYSGPKIG